MCTNGGGSHLATIEECEEGARLIGWSDTEADTESLNFRPSGCYKMTDDQM